jgi:signal recognition particle subunit SRP54
MGLGKKAKGRQAPQTKKGKGARRSGNPAKAAAQSTGEAAKPAANPFGLPGEIDLPEGLDPNQLPDLSKYLK